MCGTFVIYYRVKIVHALPGATRPPRGEERALTGQDEAATSTAAGESDQLKFAAPPPPAANRVN